MHSISTLVSLFFLISFSYAAYDSAVSTELWHYNTAAYCLPQRIQTWNVSNIQTLHPQVTDIRVYSYQPTDNLGYLAYNPTSNIIFLVFRGTMDLSIINWGLDLYFPKRKYSNCDDCAVHSGFYDSYNNLNPTAMMNDLSALVSKYPTAKVSISGHSLGGAMANLALVDACNTIGKVDLFYTFGAPRTGNAKFSDYVNKLPCGSGITKVRVVHNLDPVPHVPPSIFGFKHGQGQEIFYNWDSSAYSGCDGVEDLLCSKGVELMSFDAVDHVTYMGYNQQVQMITCSF